MKKYSILIFFICLAVFQVAGQTTLYVAPNGSGDKFSKRKPGTLSEVQTKVRSLAPAMKEDIVVILMKGQYIMDAPILLSNEDSGKNGYQIIYKAQKEGTVNLSGGAQISGWEKIHDGLYKASYEGPIFRQLYVDNERAVRARIPNKNNDIDFGSYYRTTGWNADEKYIRVKTDDISDWEGMDEIEMVIKKHWGESRMRLKTYEENGYHTHLFFQEPESSIDAWTKGCCPGFEDSQSYFFENSKAFIDEPGEWFFDQKSRTVFYAPHEGEDMNTAEVIAPAQETLLNIDGASHISFEGLIFEHTNWIMPDSARIGVQGGYRKDFGRIFILGGIQVVRSHHLRFAGNIIRHFGGAGIEFLHSTNDNIIEGNLITDISGNGIQMNIKTSSRNPKVEEMCKNEIIRDNYVFNTALDYTGSTGILASYVKNIQIEHNEVAYMPYTGISIGWGWSDTISVLENNMVRYNNIHDVGRLHDDGAGIYNLSKSEGSVITENYVHNIRRSGWAENYTYGGIYLDNGSAKILVEHNVLQNVDGFPLVAWNEPNHSNAFRNNYCMGLKNIKIRDGNILENNHNIIGNGWPAKAQEVMKKAGPRLPRPIEDL